MKHHRYTMKMTGRMCKSTVQRERGRWVRKRGGLSQRVRSSKARRGEDAGAVYDNSDTREKKLLQTHSCESTSSLPPSVRE